MKPVLVFDYDGTIHNTMKIYERAFNRARLWLKEEHGIVTEEKSREEISRWLGMNSKDMWNDFCPDISDELKDTGSKYIGARMREEIEAGNAAWFEGIGEILDDLKTQGYTMVILSNCKIIYRDTNMRIFGMERWFDAWYDCESYDFAPKTHIINDIVKKYGDNLIVIGDRDSDLAGAKAVNAPFLGCLYGYGREGELEGSDYFLNSPKDIPKGIMAVTR